MMRILLIVFSIMVAAAPATAAPGAEGGVEATPADAGNGHKYGEQTGDLPNFHEVHPYLFRGGQPTPAGLRKLKEMGVSTVIDLRGNPEQVDDESREAHALSLKYINLPMSSQAPTHKQVNTFLKEVEKAASGRSSGPVYVHCAHGSDRTGCLVGIWRVTQDGFGYDQAYQEMRKYYFSPKFTRLSGTVRSYAEGKDRNGNQARTEPPNQDSTRSVTPGPPTGN